MFLPVLIERSDLTPFADISDGQAAALIEDATAQALVAAPCLAGANLTTIQVVAARSVLRAAILRWHDAGLGARTTLQRSAGIFQESTTLDTSNARKGVFWPSEIRSLQEVCKDLSRPYTIDMSGGAAGQHALTCSRTFGALYCDCGAELGMDPE